jgi:hypothetical protein
VSVTNTKYLRFLDDPCIESHALRGLKPYVSRRARPDSIKQHGISLRRYEELLQEQWGRCAICKRFPLPDKVFAIDHDHACCNVPKSCGDCVRGLLCNSCNAYVGWMESHEAEIRAYLGWD